MIVVAPVEEADARTPGQRLAAKIGFGGEEGDRFYQEMKELLPLLRSDMPREVPEFLDDCHFRLPTVIPAENRNDG